MLSQEEIFTAICENQIEIAYYFGRDDNNKIVQFKEEKAFSESELMKYLYSDRLKLTMGCLERKIGYRRVKSKYRFKRSLYYFDLRKNEFTYIIHPQESIVILTNERIRLNGQYAAIIIPRISLSDVGIVVTPAYIDPYYDGLLRLQLTNQSNNSFLLQTLDVIAQCFFFKLSSSVEESFERGFSKKSAFFGQNWPSIIDEDRNPFPTKKGATENDESIKKRIMTCIYQLKDLIKEKGIYALLVLCIGGFILAKNKIDNINKFVESFSASAGEITVLAGEKYGTKSFTVPYDKSDIITVLYNNDKITYHIDSGTKPGECEIVFTY